MDCVSDISVVRERAAWATRGGGDLRQWQVGSAMDAECLVVVGVKFCANMHARAKHQFSGSLASRRDLEAGAGGE